MVRAQIQISESFVAMLDEISLDSISNLASLLRAIRVRKTYGEKESYFCGKSVNNLPGRVGAIINQPIVIYMTDKSNIINIPKID